MALCMGIQTALVLQMPHPRSCLVMYQVMALCMGIQSIQQTMASKLSNPIRIVSYNVRGFRSGQSFVSDLLHQCDLLCLQEHWLLDQHLSTTNICEEFIVTGVSGMEPDSLIRPFGGCAIFYQRTFPQRFPFAMSHLEGFVLYALRYQITQHFVLYSTLLLITYCCSCYCTLLFSCPLLAL